HRVFSYGTRWGGATLVRQVGAPHELRRSDLKDRSHSHCWVNGSKEIDDVSMRAMLVEHVRTPIRNSAATLRIQGGPQRRATFNEGCRGRRSQHRKRKLERQIPAYTIR